MQRTHAAATDMLQAVGVTFGWCYEAGLSAVRGRCRGLCAGVRGVPAGAGSLADGGVGKKKPAPRER